MRYVVVSVVKGEAGNFNNNLRKEVYEKFNAKSSKLPAHFTIKAPFEYDDIEELEEVLQNFCKTHKRAPYKIKNYNHFDNRAIYMEVIMSKEGKKLHDDLFDEFLVTVTKAMKEDTSTINTLVPFLLIARYLERIADRSESIGGRVLLMQKYHTE